ncbi:Bacterial SH3 domain protein [Sulfitobacter sp. THAF37]|uniref:SH3 domain-containing protein n=1 Tax=Sulfitobacter sp. THAF37 TaxID=2587855 RepID=UPI001268B94F|nr:SH3 domain-containing protein [Sulfitobacter sp. THAF37]QFT57796.1 Bacterial SH3 domain protein [Sulfitobacter sp. THAF37]
MKRFILLSFGFLGWAFYEMSGGPDFEPRSAQIASMASAAQPQERSQPTVITNIESDASAPTRSAFVDTDPPFDDSADSDVVTRVSLNLTTLTDVPNKTEAAERKITPAVAKVSVNNTGVPQNAGVLTASADTPAIIPSLIDPNDGVNMATSAATGGDVRIVSGSRVNVRGGPGTDHGVVAKLTEGDEVRVLLDNGNGWVKMQPLDGSPEGWMADWLLTGG